MIININNKRKEFIKIFFYLYIFPLKLSITIVQLLKGGDYMTNAKFENTLATFCSPVLFGKKVSNLVSVFKKEIPEVAFLVDEYNKKFKSHGIKIENICECEKRILLLVYSEDNLLKHLKEKNVSDILSSYGYIESDDLNEYFHILKMRMAKEEFPHEIGLFLGYPLSDVKGFIDNNGRNYQYCGYWKVYENINEAKEMFSTYDKLKAFTVAELECGRKLDSIVAQFQNKCIA